jgi:DNA-binding MarR family transcriptional regulator
MSSELREASRAMALLGRTLERACADLTLAQYRVLAMVASGDARASKLAERLAVARPTVTAVVDGLVERGYLRREAVPGDRRSASIVVTKEGRARLAQAEDALSARLEHLLAAVSDREAFVRGLTEIEATMRTELQAKLDAALAARR